MSVIITALGLNFRQSARALNYYFSSNFPRLSCTLKWQVIELDINNWAVVDVPLVCSHLVLQGRVSYIWSRLNVRALDFVTNPYQPVLEDNRAPCVF
jgi:hypothetical protein